MYKPFIVDNVRDSIPIVKWTSVFSSKHMAAFQALHLFGWLGSRPGSYFGMMATWQLHNKYVTMKGTGNEKRFLNLQISTGELLFIQIPAHLECVVKKCVPNERQLI